MKEILEWSFLKKNPKTLKIAYQAFVFIIFVEMVDCKHYILLFLGLLLYGFYNVPHHFFILFYFLSTIIFTLFPTTKPLLVIVALQCSMPFLLRFTLVLICNIPYYLICKVWISYPICISRFVKLVLRLTFLAVKQSTLEVRASILALILFIACKHWQSR